MSALFGMARLGPNPSSSRKTLDPYQYNIGVWYGMVLVPLNNHCDLQTKRGRKGSKVNQVLISITIIQGGSFIL
eukprot:scaffold6899_cov183-Amphora_coffeaeformis.AAC.14